MEASGVERLTCGECGAEADESAAGWRACIVAAEEREFDGPDMVALVCPDCAEQEFGES